MDLVVSHSSAEQFWSRYNGRLWDASRERFPEAMARPVPFSGSLEAELTGLGFTASAKQPLDLLFWSNGVRSGSKKVRAHAIFRALPAGALVRVSDHVLVTSPEMTYAQLAHVRTTGRLILAGCELCGCYRLFDGRGTPLSLPEERHPLTSVVAIGAMLAEMGFGPESAAGNGLRHVFENARSPMEAKTALLLSLPPRMGGYGLPRPILNAPFYLSRGAFRLYPCNPCRLDLYWDYAHLDVEYDGEESHGPDAHAKDVARAAALALDDVEVLVLAKQQVYDRRAFALLAEKLANRLGQRPRKRPDDFVSRQIRLRREFDLL